jgi:hypothetical protein
MIIKSPGSVAFSFTPEKNPNAFKDDNNVFWCNFQIDNTTGEVTSEGKTLLLTLNKNKQNEFCIFKCDITFDLSKKHVVIFTWSNEKVCLYFDGQLNQSVDPREFY